MGSRVARATRVEAPFRHRNKVNVRRSLRIRVLVVHVNVPRVRVCLPPLSRPAPPSFARERRAISRVSRDSDLLPARGERRSRCIQMDRTSLTRRVDYYRNCSRHNFENNFGHNLGGGGTEGLIPSDSEHSPGRICNLVPPIIDAFGHIRRDSCKSHRAFQPVWLPATQRGRKLRASSLNHRVNIVN